MPSPSEAHPGARGLTTVLKRCTVPALVVSIDSDLLFPSEQQDLLAAFLPEATLVKLESSDGHDGFLLEMSAMGNLIKTYLQQHIPTILATAGCNIEERVEEDVVLHSVFGEVDSHFQ